MSEYKNQNANNNNNNINDSSSTIINLKEYNTNIENISPDLISLQENIFARINKNELIMFERFKLYQDVTDVKISRIEKELDLQKTRLEEQQKLINIHNLSLDKVPEINKTLVSNSEEIFSIKCKLVNSDTNISSFCKKYDKIIFENLVLPGIIGNGAKYASLREYIEVIY